MAVRYAVSMATLAKKAAISRLSLVALPLRANPASAGVASASQRLLYEYAAWGTAPMNGAANIALNVVSPAGRSLSSTAHIAAGGGGGGVQPVYGDQKKVLMVGSRWSLSWVQMYGLPMNMTMSPVLYDPVRLQSV